MKYLMILAAVTAFIPHLSFAQGPLPRCFSEAVSAAEDYARISFEQELLSSVVLLDEAPTIRFLVTFETMSKGNKGTAEYGVELSQTCTDPVVSSISQSFSIPAGPVMVSENIPARNLTMSYKALIIQSTANNNSALILGVGRVEEFSYGLTPFSIGAYDIQDDGFIVNYFTPKSNGGLDLLQTIRLERYASGVLLIATDRSNAQASCALERKH